MSCEPIHVKSYSLCPALCVTVAASTCVHIHSLCCVPRLSRSLHVLFNLCCNLLETKITLIKETEGVSAKS
jgi:hypothetical protein